MANDVPLTSLNDGVSSLIKTCVLAPLSTWLAQTKNVVVTSEEMINALNLPRTPGLPQSVNTPDIPLFLMANQNNKNILKGQTRGRKKQTINAQDPNAKTCVYIFKKGANVDKKCTELCEPGQEYCKHCLKKQGVQQKLKSKDSDTGNPINTSLLSDTPTFEQDNSTQQIVDAVSYPELGPGVFLEQKTHFIIQQLPNGEVIAIGYHDDTKITDKDRPLTDAEKEIAKSMNLEVTNDEQSQEALAPV